jgi:hypothetical protein
VCKRFSLDQMQAFPVGLRRAGARSTKQSLERSALQRSDPAVACDRSQAREFALRGLLSSMGNGRVAPLKSATLQAL